MTSPHGRLDIRKQLLAITHYSLGSLLTTLAGLVSFPFLTRVFSVSDYGVLSLISVSLTLLVGVGKLGLQHAVVRFAGRLGENNRRADRHRVVSTAVVSMVAAGFATSLVWLAAVAILPSRWLAEGRMRALAGLIAALVLIQVVESAFVSLLRADQRTALLNGYQVTKKYSVLGLTIAALLLLGPDLHVLYSTQVATETAAVLFLAFLVLHARANSVSPSLAAFSVPLLGEMLQYGLPMMLGWELSGLVLSLGDRYLLQGILGSEQLGVYAASYGLCQYVETILFSPWGLAMTPIYVRLWEERGSEATLTLLNRSLQYYVLLAAPVVAGLAATGPDLLALLASEKYRHGALVIPPVIAGLVAAGAAPLTGAGAFIHKQTARISGSVIGCSLLNLGLNLFLIPAQGVFGAALATLVSYVALLLCVSLAGRRCLPVTIPWALAGRAGGTAAVMYAIVAPIEMGTALGNLTAKVLLGVTIYSSVILAVEPHARQAVRALAGRTRSSKP